MASKERVLVVENYSDLLMLVTQTLLQRNYRCDAVHDPAEAVARLKKQQYASILLDVTWPVTTDPVITFLQQEQPDELRKVIVMTAFDPRYLGLEELEHICTFLRKPFGIDELLARLAQCV